MGWVLFLIGVFVVVPVGWLLLARTSADRLLTVVGLTLLPPTIWSGALGLKIGPCKVGSCVSHSEHNLLVFAVAAFVVLVVALVALALLQTIPGALLMTLAAALEVVSAVKIDTVTALMFGILAGVAALYFILALLPAVRSRPEPHAAG
jgi:hypothetical protein